MRRCLSSLLGCALTLAAVGPLQAQMTIDTRPGATVGGTFTVQGNYNAGDAFGYRNGVGQTITLDALSRFDSFTFFLLPGSRAPTEIYYRAVLAGWDAAGSRTTGALWSSDPYAAVTTAAGQEVSFLPNVKLGAGTYALFLEAVDQASGAFSGTANTAVQYVRDPGSGGGYQRGSLITKGTSDQSVDLGNVSGWTVYNGASNYDASFAAYFDGAVPATSTVTPEPVSMALLGTGLMGIGAAARRRRRERGAEA